MLRFKSLLNSLPVIIALLGGCAAQGKIFGPFSVTYSQSLADRSPVSGNGQVEVKLVLVRFNQIVSIYEVWLYMKEQGLKPAKEDHLRAFGAKFPDNHWTIVATGSGWVDPYGDSHMSYLDEYGSLRDLSLRWGALGDRWSDWCRFLAVSQ